MAAARQERFLMRQRGAGARELGDDDFDIALPGLPAPAAQTRRTPGTAAQRAKKTPKSSSSATRSSSRKTASTRRQQAKDAAVGSSDQAAKVDDDSSVVKRRKVVPIDKQGKTPSTRNITDEGATIADSTALGSDSQPNPGDRPFGSEIASVSKKRKRRKSTGQQTLRKTRNLPTPRDVLAGDDRGQDQEIKGADQHIVHQSAESSGLLVVETQQDTSTPHGTQVGEDVATSAEGIASLSNDHERSATRQSLQLDAGIRSHSEHPSETPKPPTKRSKRLAATLATRSTSDPRQSVSVSTPPIALPEAQEPEEAVADDAEPGSSAAPTKAAARDPSILSAVQKSTPTVKGKRKKRKSVTMPRRKARGNTSNDKVPGSSGSVAEAFDAAQQEEPIRKQARPKGKALTITRKSARNAAAINNLTAAVPKKRGRPPKVATEVAKTSRSLQASKKQSVRQPEQRKLPSKSKLEVQDVVADPRPARSREDAIPITIYRLAGPNALAVSNSALGDRVRMASSIDNSPNAIDVLNQVCSEIVTTTIETMTQAERQLTDRVAKAVARRKRVAVERFGQELSVRLLDMTQAVDKNTVLATRLRQVKKARKESRRDLLDATKAKDELEGKLYQLRKRHELAQKVAAEDRQIEAFVEGISQAVRQGMAGQANGSDTVPVGLQFDLRRAQAYHMIDGRKGLLESVKRMESVFGRAVAAL